MCNGSLRQFFGHLLSPETGRYSRPFSLHHCMESPVLVQNPEYQIQNPAHSGQIKYDCRRSLETRSSPSYGMEPSLNRLVANQVFRLWNTPHLDLFATRFNNLLPLFVSPVRDHRTCAVDTISMDWRNFTGYAFPPFNLIPQVLAKIKESQCRLILIDLLWPQRSWFPIVLSLLTDTPRRLSVSHGIVSQNQGKPMHPDPGLLHLHALKLSAVKSETETFLSSLPNASIKTCSTLSDGRFMQIGVLKGKSILSILSLPL